MAFRNILITAALVTMYPILCPLITFQHPRGVEGAYWCCTWYGHIGNNGLVHMQSRTNEGLGNLAGDPNQYFLRVTDVNIRQGFSLLRLRQISGAPFPAFNCRYWLEEFRFDGSFWRVTSMLYYTHGLGRTSAIMTTTLTAIRWWSYSIPDPCQQAIHEFRPNAITIAEEVECRSGAPLGMGGWASTTAMAMNIPDYWIKIIKEKKDEDWSMAGIFWEVTNRRSDEKTISCWESWPGLGGW